MRDASRGQLKMEAVDGLNLSGFLRLWEHPKSRNFTSLLAGDLERRALFVALFPMLVLTPNAFPHPQAARPRGHPVAGTRLVEPGEGEHTCTRIPSNPRANATTPRPKGTRHPVAGPVRRATENGCPSSCKGGEGVKGVKGVELLGDREDQHLHVYVHPHVHRCGC